MTDSIDTIHFQDLSRLNPRDVCKRSLCKYDEKRKYYLLSVWGDEYRIFPDQSKIDCINNNENLHEYFNLFMIQYLLHSNEIDIAHEWISEKDIPGGPTFFRGPHDIPTRLITDRFENNIHYFKKRCELLQGVPLDMADAAYRFEIAPRVPVAVLYWEGDEDFPAESKLLYDRTITEHFASDIVYAVAVGICKKLGEPIG